jgi:nucleoside-diphosphate-sugar epimerase
MKLKYLLQQPHSRTRKTLTRSYTTATENMLRSTVFITGATGFIGAHIAALASRAGYHVKLSVRREAQIDSLRRVLSDFSDRLDFVIIPDYTKENAFDTALQGVKHVIHVASPLPKPGEDLLTPAVKGTTSMLESASRVPSVEKVVITASVASLIPLGQYGNDLVVTGKR